jgi:general L-amino acid transport system permease protein
MTAIPATEPFVRSTDAPHLPPPPNMAGIRGWLLKSLFSSIWSGIASILVGAFLLWFAWGFVRWGIIDATWTGDNREACAREGAGACWPLVVTKMPQWIYGFYPIDQRWRVNICFLIGAAALAPLMIPSMPYKRWNALFLLIVYPLLVFILMTGGHVAFPAGRVGGILGLLLLSSALLPVLAFGIEDGVRRNRIGLALAAAAF